MFGHHETIMLVKKGDASRSARPILAVAGAQVRAHLARSQDVGKRYKGPEVKVYFD